MRLRNAFIGALFATSIITPLNVWAEEGEEAATEQPKAETPAAPAEIPRTTEAPAAKQTPKIDEKKIKQLVDEVTKEANNGNPDAQYSLALLNVMGKGMPRDLPKALQWFLKAAEKGHAIAQHNAGVMYLGGGDGIEQNFNKAISWFNKAAAQGYVESQFNLGLMYERGEGIKQDYAKALQWYRKAAEQEYPDAQYNLGGLYLRGQGVKQDFAKAAKYFTAAADQGQPDAQNNLALMYYEGQGVKKDPVQAYKWVLLAAVQQHPIALKGRDQLQNSLSKTQLAEGERLAKAWIKERVPAAAAQQQKQQTAPAATPAATE